MYHSYSAINDDSDVKYSYTTGRIINIGVTLIVGVIIFIFLGRCNLFWSGLLTRDQNFISFSYFYIVACSVFICLGFRKFQMEILNYGVFKILPTLYVLFLVFLYQVGKEQVGDESSMMEVGNNKIETVEDENGIELQEGDEKD